MWKKIFLWPLIGIGLLLMDSQVGFLLNLCLPNTFQGDSYLLILYLILLASVIDGLYPLVLFFVLGVCYDFFYLGLSGFSMTLLPIFVIIANAFFKTNRLYFSQYVLLFLVYISFMELGLFGVSHFWGLTSYHFVYFIVKIVAPTLVWNLTIGMLLYPLIKRIMRDKRYLIVTNM